MTTVIVDLIEKKVYSDSRMTCRDITYTGLLGLCGISTKPPSEDYFGEVTKIHRLYNLSLVAGAGNTDDINLVRACLQNNKYLIGRSFSGSSRVLHIYQDSGEVVVKVYKGNKVFGGYKCEAADFILPKLKGYLAVGSGADYALGALASGATPEQAICAAAKLDDGTDNKIQVEDIMEIKYD